MRGSTPAPLDNGRWRRLGRVRDRLFSAIGERTLQVGHVHVEPSQDLARETLDVQDAEKHVLGVDFVRTALAREASGPFQGACCARAVNGSSEPLTESVVPTTSATMWRAAGAWPGPCGGAPHTVRCRR